MEQKPVKFDLEDIKKAVIRKFPLVADAFANVNFHEMPEVKTAATDGKDILYNPEFMDSLSYEDQIFTLAHEALHIAFDHINRRKIKIDNLNDSKRVINKYKQLWNVATDAVINQALHAEGLPIKKGCVNIKEALNKQADAIYDKLLEEFKKQQEGQSQSSKGKEDQDNEQGNSQGGSSGNGQSSNDEKRKTPNSNNGDSNENEDSEEQSIEDWAKKFGDTYDDHDFWDNQSEADINGTQGEYDENSPTESQTASNSEDNLESEQKVNSQESDDENTQNDTQNGKELEKDFSQKNDDKKKEITNKVMQKIKEQKDKAKEFGNAMGGVSGTFGDVGRSKSLYNWKRILNREFNDYIRQWSSRRATYENDYQSRIVSNYMYDKPRTEIILDTSGSIDDELLKGFIRQLKPMLIDSQLFVGCFDTKFYGFTEIKSNKDIDNFRVVGRGGTDLDVAVRGFTKDDKINKVIFTDGCGTMPSKDLEKTKRLFWVIFDKKNFEPCCGKVLYADANEIRKEYVKLIEKDREM